MYQDISVRDVKKMYAHDGNTFEGNGMARSLPITAQQIDYLCWALANKVQYNQMAKDMGCCTDTLKRILVREGLAEFPGAKFGMSLTRERKMTEQLWQRPCMICKCTEPRPKNQWVCDSCHKKQEDASACGDRWSGF